MGNNSAEIVVNSFREESPIRKGVRRAVVFYYNYPEGLVEIDGTIYSSFKSSLSKTLSPTN